ncbi:MAG: tetratricopeptide repeat protein [Propionibacteriaceae bacterium]|jgi:hypothetical protein|nr:tetratricopeptide repeat protein [Propionibacteriaceae bacterium]
MDAGRAVTLDASRTVKLKHSTVPGSSPEKAGASGWRLGRGLVLTARHCSEAGTSEHQVLAESGNWLRATVAWASPDPAVDLALWRVDDFAHDEPTPLARFDRNSAVGVPATALGYPIFLRSQPPAGAANSATDPSAPTRHGLAVLPSTISPAQGTSPGQTGASLSLVLNNQAGVTSSGEQPEDWRGLSGGPILVEHGGVTHCVGVVVVRKPELASNVFTASGFDQLAGLAKTDAAGFWELVTWATAADLPRLGDSRSLRLVWTDQVPGQSPHYVDRPATSVLQKQLDTTGRATLYGLRGAGKSQIAAALVRLRTADHWPVVAWINAESRSSIQTDLRLMAASLGLEQPGEEPEATVRHLVNHWNSQPQRRLLVFDNLTALDHLSGCLPDPAAAQVVVTTADRAAALNRSGPSLILVQPFAREDSVAYLRNSTGLDDAGGADQVAQQLGDLPLALAQAAGVIALRRQDDHQYGHTAYLADLEALPPNLVLTPDGDLASYPNSTARAITLALSAVLPAKGDCRALTQAVLDLMALFDPAGVRRSHLSPLAHDDAAGRSNLAQVLTRLEDASLISRSYSDSRDLIVMHRLVSRVVRHQHGTKKRRKKALVPVRAALASISPLQPIPAADPAIADDYLATRALAAEMASHLTWLLSYSELARSDQLILRERLHCGRALNELHGPSTAIHLLEPTLKDLLRVLGPDHPDTLTARNNLAYAHESAGRLDLAIPMHERNLADSLRVLGPDHPDTLRARNNLAVGYWLSDCRSKAIELMKRVVRDAQSLSSDHPVRRTVENSLQWMESEY